MHQWGTGTAFVGIALDWDGLGGIRQCGMVEVACTGLGRRFGCVASAGRLLVACVGVGWRFGCVALAGRVFDEMEASAGDGVARCCVGALMRWRHRLGTALLRGDNLASMKKSTTWW